MCRQKTRLFAVLSLENRHEIALYRSASQFYILRKMPRKPDESSVECYGHGFLIAAWPRGGIEHYGNWVCRSTTSLRERWRKTMQIGSPSKRQELGCGTESRSIPAQSKPTTDSAIACSKNYKAKGSILCASIFDQWVALEWLKACCTDMITWICQALRLGRNTEHDDSKELPVMAM